MDKLSKFESIDDYLKYEGITREEVIEIIARSALSLLMYVHDGSEVEPDDIVKISSPLYTLYDMVTKISRDSCSNNE